MTFQNSDNRRVNLRINFNDGVSVITFGFAVNLHKGNIQINTAAHGCDIGQHTFFILMMDNQRGICAGESDIDTI